MKKTRPLVRPTSPPPVQAEPRSGTGALPAGLVEVPVVGVRVVGVLVVPVDVGGAADVVGGAAVVVGVVGAGAAVVVELPVAAALGLGSRAAALCIEELSQAFLAWAWAAVETAAGTATAAAGGGATGRVDAWLGVVGAGAARPEDGTLGTDGGGAVRVTVDPAGESVTSPEDGATTLTAAGAEALPNDAQTARPSATTPAPAVTLHGGVPAGRS